MLPAEVGPTDLIYAGGQMPSVSGTADTSVNLRCRDQSGSSFPQTPPHAPLHHPRYPPHIGFFERVRPRLITRQEQNRLLNIRGEVHQPHNVHHDGGDLASEFDAACLSSNPVRSADIESNTLAITLSHEII